MKTLPQLEHEWGDSADHRSIEQYIYDYGVEQVDAERERIKKELLDIINLYNDNEMFGFSVAKNAIENL